MSETPFFFTRGDVRLFAILHAPQGASSRLAFLMSHPFGEEKLWSHRVYVSFARALAARGHAVLRFDYMGAGDSAGWTVDTTLETHLLDLEAARAALLARVPGLESVGMAGLRLGGTFAALVAERLAQSGAPSGLAQSPLVLWDPVVDGHAYLEEVLRSNLSTQMSAYGRVREDREALQARIRAGGVVNVDGYEIGKPLFESCARRDLLPLGAKQYPGPVLVLQVAANEKVGKRNDLDALAASYPKGSLGRVTEQAFWREIKQFYGRAANLQSDTLRWLESLDG